MSGLIIKLGEEMDLNKRAFGVGGHLQNDADSSQFFLKDRITVSPENLTILFSTSAISSVDE